MSVPPPFTDAVTTERGTGRDPRDGATPTVLLTAAGGGIVAASARLFAERGWNVALASSSGRAEELARDLGGLGFTFDLRDGDALLRCIDETWTRFGSVQAVVNGAGHGPKGALHDLDEAAWQAGFDMYFTPVVRTSRALAPRMAAAGGGAFVNVSSFAAIEPDADFPTSAVARAALRAYTKMFADRHAAQGVRMNDLLPGFVDSLPSTEARVARIPAGRYATVREAAETIYFLASPASSYLTGQAIRLDGGLTRSL